MGSLELPPNEEATQPVIIGQGEHIVLDESVEFIKFSIPSDLKEVWPEDLSRLFRVSEGKIFWILTEVNDSKEEDDLMIIRHRKKKEINTKTFLETDMMRGKKEKRLGIAIAASAITLAAAAFLVVQKRKD